MVDITEYVRNNAGKAFEFMLEVVEEDRKAAGLPDIATARAEAAEDPKVRTGVRTYVCTTAQYRTYVGHPAHRVREPALIHNISELRCTPWKDSFFLASAYMYP